MEVVNDKPAVGLSEYWAMYAFSNVIWLWYWTHPLLRSRFLGCHAMTLPRSLRDIPKNCCSRATGHVIAYASVMLTVNENIVKTLVFS